jgi:hypothetical protein
MMEAVMKILFLFALYGVIINAQQWTVAKARLLRATAVLKRRRLRADDV